MLSRKKLSEILLEPKLLFHMGTVRVRVRPLVFADLLGGWGLLAWIAGSRRPQRSWLQRLGVSWLSLAALLIADLGHATAHTFSARLAGAPVDEILISPEMPRTLYENNDLPPNTHRLRALGGPIFSI